jgi:ribonuclease D
MPEQELPHVIPVWVDTQSKLEDCCLHLSIQSSIGIDTESNSLFAYNEQTCLIQISSPKKDFLIDPLSISDISALQPIFANPSIEKVFHAAEYDILCMKRDFYFEFVSIFDTMLACRILGWKELSLSAQLTSQFGIDMDKHFQKANWGLRPLSDEQKTYAALDSHFLLSLRDRLKEALSKAGLLKLAAEDFAHMAAIKPPDPHEKDECANINGKGKLSPDEYSVLKALCHFREVQAQKRDVPPFKVLGSAVLLDLAKECPSSLEELSKVEGMSESLVHRYGNELLKVIEKGKNAHSKFPSAKPKPDAAYLHRLELLKQWRKAEAASLSVESDVVLPRELMDFIARDNPQSQQRLREIMKDYPWRFQRSGESILANLKGRNSNENGMIDKDK